MCEKFVRESDACPTIAQLFKHERAKPLEPLYPNCQTPPSLFSIWSGRTVQEHQITGYDVPALQATNPLGFTNGFTNWPLEIPLVWEHYAGADQSVRLCAVPFVRLEALGSNLLTSTHVFTSTIIPAFVVPLGSSVSLPALDASLSCNPIADNQFEVSLRRNQKCLAQTVLTACHIWHSFLLPLQELLPQESQTCAAVQVGVFYIEGVARFCGLNLNRVEVYGRDTQDYREHFRNSAYATDGLCQQYRQGKLGAKLTEQGDGTSEAILLSSLEQVHECFLQDVLWALEPSRNQQDLTVAYYPVLDLLQHEVLALLHHPAYATHPEFKQKADAVFIQALRWVDSMLSKLFSLIPADYRIIVNSDHGMLPIFYTIYPNVYFHKMNWLVMDHQSNIDFARSMCYYHPAENGLLVFNQQIMRENQVSIETIVDSFIQYLETLDLAGAKCLPMTMNPDNSCDQGRIDYYLCPPQFTRAKSNLNGEFVSKSQKMGDHTTYSEDFWLKGIVFDASNFSAKNSSGFYHKDVYELTDLLPEILDL